MLCVARFNSGNGTSNVVKYSRREGERANRNYRDTSEGSGRKETAEETFFSTQYFNEKVV